MTTNASQKAVGTEEQYSLVKILGIWAVVALPMPLLTYVVTPALIPHVNLHPGSLSSLCGSSIVSKVTYVGRRSGGASGTTRHVTPRRVS